MKEAICAIVKGAGSPIELRREADEPDRGHQRPDAVVRPAIPCGEARDDPRCIRDHLR
jgi:hypothetical protein